MVKKKKRKRTHVHTKGYTSYCRQLTSTVHKKIGAGSYRAARGSYPAARCVSPSFSFSSTAGQRRWDFRKRLPSINCDSHLCTKDRKVINWRKLCVEDQIDCGGRELEPTIAQGESKLNNFPRGVLSSFSRGRLIHCKSIVQLLWLCIFFLWTKVSSGRRRPDRTGVAIPLYNDISQ